VARFIRVYGEDDLESTPAYSGLGALLKAQGNFEEAEQYYRKALAIRERELGADDDSTKLIQARLTDLLKIRESKND